MSKPAFFSARSRRVLIVDDEPDILEPLAILLEGEGFAVETVSKGEQTFQIINEFHPQLIFLDVLMSGTDGREICKQLKKDSDTCNIPIIMMSAHPTAGRDADSCGADDFMPKPFELDTMLGLVKKHLS